MDEEDRQRQVNSFNDELYTTYLMSDDEKSLSRIIKILVQVLNTFLNTFSMKYFRW